MRQATDHFRAKIAAGAAGDGPAYNAERDQTRVAGWDYTYDAVNRLVFAAPADHKGEAEGFTYDAGNRLTSGYVALCDLEGQCDAT